MSREKLRRIIALLVAEAETPGPRAPEVLTKLHELATLYEEAVAASPTRDRRLQKAMQLLSAHLAEPWTVESLAKAVGMSRAAFARRFVAAFGVSPLQHLHELRMEAAAALLVDTDESLVSVAARVGYTSEFAFSRAFKRHHSLAPGAFRRTRRDVTMHAGGRLRLAA